MPQAELPGAESERRIRQPASAPGHRRGGRPWCHPSPDATRRARRRTRWGAATSAGALAEVAPQRALLAMVKLPIAVKFPRIVGDLDVDRWQAKVVPLRFAAKVHAYLSGNEQRLPSVWAPRRPAATAAPVRARTDLCSAADLAAGAVGPAGPPRRPELGRRLARVRPPQRLPRRHSNYPF